MPKVERHGGVGLGQRTRHGRPVLNLGSFDAEFVVLVFELELSPGRVRLVAFATDPEAPTQQAFGFRFIAFDASLLARSAASGASAIDHNGGDDAKKSDVVARSWLILIRNKLALGSSIIIPSILTCVGR